jgi:hypothetical protein
MKSWWLSFAGGSALLVALGCGGGTSSANLNLTGKVTIKGAPAKNVLIRLIDKNGAEYAGSTDGEGNFTITAVPAGEMVVTIAEPPSMAPNMGGPPTGGPLPIDAKQKALAKEMQAKLKESAPPGTTARPESSKVPPKYSDKSKSGLTWSVSPQNLTKDFNLD